MSEIGSKQTIIEDISAKMAFTKPGDICPDEERPGMLRATTTPHATDMKQAYDLSDCRLKDWSSPSAGPLNLEKMGFDTIDISSLTSLQTTLETICQANRITELDASVIRKQLRGSSFKLSSGKRLRLLFVAPEGLIMRKAGPNACQIDPEATMSKMNGHDGALTVHGDQDVRGTPLKQMMHGAAPWIFRHQSPDGKNALSPFFLTNIWIPLQQVCRPLTLMDRRTLNNQSHQLRYALPTEDFLKRDDETRVNDIWAFLPDEKQQWYFHSSLDANSAYVFDTLGTPHGSAILPGEQTAEIYFQRLRAACKAIETGDIPELAQAISGVFPTIPAETTAPLRHAIIDMETLLKEAQEQCLQPNFIHSDWGRRAQLRSDSVVRKSIEMRAVAMVTPDIWPFNR